MNSIQRWIYQPRRLSMAARILLPYYCARANGELACFPSYSRTGRDCELARKTVIIGTEELCATGLLKVVRDPVERAAILAKAGAKDNCRANVYRIGYSNSAYDGVTAPPSDSVAATPTRPDGVTAPPSQADKMAKLRAMCVPFRPPDGNAATPLDPPDGNAATPTDGGAVTPVMVTLLPVDGNAATPELLKELKESELQAGAEAPAGAPVAARSLPSGAPGATRATVPHDDEGLPEQATTIGGALAQAPVLGETGETPANALRRPGAPPDPFADWLDQGAPPDRAIAAAIPRPKPIYAPLEARKAARESLAQRHAALVSS